MKLIFLLFPILALGQNLSISKDSLIITIKLKIENKGILKKDTIYTCGKVNVMIDKETIFIYGEHQYLKIKIKP
jgi:hypothetical protein